MRGVKASHHHRCQGTCDAALSCPQPEAQVESRKRLRSEVESRKRLRSDCERDPSDEPNGGGLGAREGGGDGMGVGSEFYGRCRLHMPLIEAMIESAAASDTSSGFTVRGELPV